MKTFLARALALILLVLPAQGTPLSGTKSVGPTGDYASLTAAIADIQAVGNGLGGALVLELQATYLSILETFPLTIPALNGASAVNTLTIRPASGATALAISSADTTAATVDLNGAQFVTIDGRPGGVGSNAGSGGGAASQLTIANTDVDGVALRFINEAGSNTIRYTALRGVNTSDTDGTVVFSTTTGANGNDNNTIDHCDIRDGASTPANGIYASGTTTTTARANSGNIVSNCNVFNFYSGTDIDAAGVWLGGGNTDWILSGNSFYQTVSRAAVAARVRVISIYNPSGNNFTVTGNFIGGSAPNAASTAWTTTGMEAEYYFTGIELHVGATVPSSVQGNIVKNFVWTSSSSSFGLFGVWNGIYVGAGSVNIGTTTGNTIGSNSGTASISVATSGSWGTTNGISATGGGACVISNNTIGSIITQGTETDGSPSTLIAAWIAGITVSTGNHTISNNLIGSNTTANSINAASSTEDTQNVAGILCENSTSAIITDNTVANLNNNVVGIGTTSDIRGIVTDSGVNTITGNTVRNLTTTSESSGGSSDAAVVGIHLESTTTGGGQTIARNVVHSLTNLAAASTASSRFVTGIYYSGDSEGTNVIERNLVHSLAIANTSNSTSQVNGMVFDTGTFTARNNMVRVGLNATGTGTAGAAILRGIYDNATTSVRKFYHNSVYVGGLETSGAASTYAFHSIGVTNTRDFRNNLFVNARSNSGGTGKHYAVRYGGTTVNPAGLTANHNLFFVSGTGGVFGFYNGDRTTLAAWQTATGWDAASLNANPLYVAPTGTAATVDLHVQANTPAEGAGVGVGVTDDFDGQTRSALSPVDLGADAGDFGLGLAYPVLGFGSTASRVLSGWATIASPGGVSGGASAPRFYFKKSTDADVFGVANDSTGNGWKYVTASNGSSPYSFTVNYALLTGGGVSSGQSIQYFVVAQDDAGNFRSTPYGAATSGSPPVQNVSAKPADGVNSYSIVDTIGGTVTVGPGGTFTSLSSAGGLFAALNSRVLTGNLTVNVTGNITTENGSTALNALTSNNNYPLANAFTVTVRPDSATMRTISGAGASGLIRLSGAQRLTIDGSFGGTGRYLTFRNTNANGPTLLFINDASNNTVRNSVVEGARNSFTSGVVFFSTGLLTGNDSNTVTGNQIRDRSDTTGVPGTLVSSTGTSATVANSDNTISNNELFNFSYCGVYVELGSESWSITGNTIYRTTPASGGYYGIFFAGLGTNLIRGNTVRDLTTSDDVFGIFLANPGNATVAGNRIWNLGNTAGSTSDVQGIHVFANAGYSVTVVNNMVALSSSGTTAQELIGIQDNVGTGSTVVIAHNTVLITGTGGATPNRKTWAFNSPGTSTATVKNNIFLNLRTGGTSHFAANRNGLATGPLTMDYNVYAGTGLSTAANFFESGDGSGGGFGAPISYAQWQTLVPSDTHSSAGNPGGNYGTALFVNAATADLHLVPGGNVLVNALGTPIAGVTDDYDGDPRNPSTPSIGADEFPLPDIAVAQTTALADGGSVSFGTVTSGSSSAKTFTITNPGTAELSGLAVSGGTGEFSVSALSGTTIPVGGGSVTFTVTFTPNAGGASGARSAALHVASNVPGTKNPFDIALTGTTQTAFQAWAAANGGANDPDALGANGQKNVVNFAFSMNPAGPALPLVFNGTLAGGGTIGATGLPVTWMEGTDCRALFIVRKDAAAAGLTYTPQFSADFTSWQTSAALPVVLADDGTNQILSVPYPALMVTQGAGFFHVHVNLAP